MSQIIKDVRCIDGFLHNVLVDIDCVNNIIGEETLVDLGISCSCSGSSGSGSGESGNNSGGSSGPPPICDGVLQVFNSVFVYETLPGIYEGVVTGTSSDCFDTGDTVVLYSPDAPDNPQPGDWIVTTTTSMMSNEYWICTDTANFLTNINLPDGANFSQSGGCAPTELSVKCVDLPCCGITPENNPTLYLTITSATGSCSCFIGTYQLDYDNNEDEDDSNTGTWNTGYFPQPCGLFGLPSLWYFQCTGDEYTISWSSEPCGIYSDTTTITEVKCSPFEIHFTATMRAAVWAPEGACCEGTITGVITL